MLCAMASDLLICVATELEGALLKDRLPGGFGRIGQRDIELVVTGVGPVNAAHAASRREALRMRGATRTFRRGSGAAALPSPASP